MLRILSLQEEEGDFSIFVTERANVTWWKFLSQIHHTAASKAPTESTYCVKHFNTKFHFNFHDPSLLSQGLKVFL